jgi:hypothetical protein
MAGAIILEAAFVSSGTQRRMSRRIFRLDSSPNPPTSAIMKKTTVITRKEMIWL